MVNLTDNKGETIYSNGDLWYKVTLADGTELGTGDRYITGDPSYKDGRTLVKVVPAGQGLVFRYQRHDGDNTPGLGWPIGDKGYLRGLQVHPDGSQTALNLSLSADPARLCLFNNNSNYGIIAKQLPSNRVALYAYNGHETVCGLRVVPDGTVVAQNSTYALALDCEFVKVSSGEFQGLF